MSYPAGQGRESGRFVRYLAGANRSDKTSDQMINANHKRASFKVAQTNICPWISTKTIKAAQAVLYDEY
jgi:hypothetical protein